MSLGVVFDRMLAALLSILAALTAPGGTAQYATISCSSSGNNEIVAAVSGKKIRVLYWIVSVSGGVNFQWRSASTNKTGAFTNSAAGGGAGGSYNPLGHFETVASEALNLYLSESVTVGGYLVYVAV
jgi:hypothetical protein